mgnify:CR=1 FL=1
MNELMIEQTKELIHQPLRLLSDSRDNLKYMEQNHDMINEHNKAQIIILREKLLGEDIKPYLLIPQILDNLKKN